MKLLLILIGLVVLVGICSWNIIEQRQEAKSFCESIGGNYSYDSGHYCNGSRIVKAKLFEDEFWAFYNDIKSNKNITFNITK